MNKIPIHCNRPLSSKVLMASGSRWLEPFRIASHIVIHLLSHVTAGRWRHVSGSRWIARNGGARRGAAWRAVLCGAACTALIFARPAVAAYSISQYGSPKYPPDFKHFDYVNPNAPKGGTLVLANPNRQTSFDKFDPFTMRGNPAPGVDLLFESLTVGSSDEVASAY